MVMAGRLLGRAGFFLVLLLLMGIPSRAGSPPPLAHGVNITGWFRYPASRDPAVLAAYLSDPAIAGLRRAGFDFIRLAIDPDVVADPAVETVMLRAIARIEAQGLSVIVSPHPVSWRLEDQGARLRSFWQRLAPLLAPLDQARTVPEVVNDPVFAYDVAGWAALQHAVLGDIRAVLPHATVVLTGQDWGSIRGLLSLTPEPDPNVLYSFHFYDPVELTSLAAWRPGLDRKALARLPFPAADRPSCVAAAGEVQDQLTRDTIRAYCSYGWVDAALRQPVERAAAWAQSHHVRLLAGEFGATAALNAPARLAWFRTIRAAFAAADIPWGLWGYDDVMGLGVPRPPPRQPHLDPAVLTALALTPGP